MGARTPAGRLVAAFGKVDEMKALYAPDIQWSLSASAGFPRPMKGMDAVVAFNAEVWTKHYRADCQVTILDEAGDEAVSAVRFIYRAYANVAQVMYENEYTLFARSGPAGITEVFEAFDSGFARDFFTRALAERPKT
jgi:hypothetical protein